MQEQTREQQVEIARAFALLRCKGETVDAIELAGRIRSEWGVRIDWHVTALALEGLVSFEAATFRHGGRDGQQLYHIQKGGSVKQLTLTCGRCNESRTFEGETLDAIIAAIDKSGWRDGPGNSTRCPHCDELEDREYRREAELD